MNKIEEIIFKRKFYLTNTLLIETIKKSVEIGVLNKTKSDPILYNCYNNVYNINEIHVISLTLNSINGLVEKLDQTESSNNKQLFSMAFELSKLNDINLTNDIIEKVKDLDEKDCLIYLLNMS